MISSARFVNIRRRILKRLSADSGCQCQVSYIFSIGLYALAQTRAKRPLLVCALFYCAGFVIDTMLLDQGSGTSLLNYHVLTNINGMALSLPSIIALYLYVFEWRGAVDKLYYLNLFLLSAVASGIKGPAALVLVAALFGTVVIRALLCRGRTVGRVLAVACVLWLVLGTRALLNQVRFAIADNTERRSEWMTEGDRANPGYLTAGELEAMEWIRDHTPKDSVLAVDRQSLRIGGVTSEDDCRFFYYSAFSERSVYLEGFSYSDADRGLIEERLAVNNRIYQAVGSDFREAVREAGVNYIVVTKRLAEAAGGSEGAGFAQDGTTAGEGAVKPVFSNEDVEIYEVAVQPD